MAGRAQPSVRACLRDLHAPGGRGGADGNPFGERPRWLARLDQLARNEDLQAELNAAEWDLVVVDEAHKMSAHYYGNELKRTKRYELGEQLGARSRHLLLMTATPHSGKEEGVKANVVFFERKGASQEPATRELWVYDFRTNQHFTLKTRTLKRHDLDDFVAAYKPGRLHEREGSERFKRYSFDEIKDRASFNLDLWPDVQDESLEDASNLPAPEVIAEEIVENLTAALGQFQAVAEMLSGKGANGKGDADAVEALLPDEEPHLAAVDKRSEIKFRSWYR